MHRVTHQMSLGNQKRMFFPCLRHHQRMMTQNPVAMTGFLLAGMIRVETHRLLLNTNRP